MKFLLYSVFYGHVNCQQKYQTKHTTIPVHSVTIEIEIYSGIALYPCDSAAFLYLNTVLLIGLELSVR